MLTNRVIYDSVCLAAVQGLYLLMSCGISSQTPFHLGCTSLFPAQLVEPLRNWWQLWWALGKCFMCFGLHWVIEYLWRWCGAAQGAGAEWSCRWAGSSQGEILGDPGVPSLPCWILFSVCLDSFSTVEEICQFKCGFDRCKSSPCRSAGFGFVLPTQLWVMEGFWWSVEQCLVDTFKKRKSTPFHGLVYSNWKKLARRTFTSWKLNRFVYSSHDSVFDCQDKNNLDVWLQHPKNLPLIGEMGRAWPQEWHSQPWVEVLEFPETSVPLSQVCTVLTPLFPWKCSIFQFPLVKMREREVWGMSRQRVILLFLP